MQPALIVVITLFLLSNIQISNVAYMRKDVERQATMSAMSRMLSVLESYDDYIYGESKVAILGDISGSDMAVESGFADQIVGVSYRNQITNRNVLERYFDVVLQYPINLCTVEENNQILQTEAYQKMPAFPRKGCIATLDGVIVVKMSQ